MDTKNILTRLLFLLLTTITAIENASISDVAYDDLERLNATCNFTDSCQYQRTKDSLDEYNCNCDQLCSLLDTCCVDSEYRTKIPNKIENLKCKVTYNYRSPQVYWVDNCESNYEDESTRRLCNSSAEELDDPLLKVPVTDPVIGISFKNYFCFACNRRITVSDEPIFWKVRLSSRTDEVKSLASLPELHFDSNSTSWVIGKIEPNVVNPVVYFFMVVPDELHPVLRLCHNQIISDCAWNWTDLSVQEKCHDYMALVRFDKDFDIVTYRNPHCAICNFEDIGKRICIFKEYPGGYGGYGGVFFLQLFTLSDKVKEVKKCEENMMFDSFAKKCRRVYKG